jgi:bifunctional enzyme CysN/CysC
MENIPVDPIEQKMNIVFVGHVDHGKSTIVGRLLADTGSLPKGKLEQVKLNCERNDKPFEYAFLIDALKHEQSQGITIDSARVFFHTDKREYIIIDAPGHIEFLKNMITGAARAEAALLVIDALENIQENTRRHGYLLWMLSIKKIVVLVNKMDLVGFRKEVFDSICTEYNAFLEQIGVKPITYIPVSGMQGDNVASSSVNMPWYQGHTVVSVLDTFEPEKPAIDKPFRLPVQDVYKFTSFGDKRRIVAGKVISGAAKINDEIIFHPSGKRSVIKSFEAFNRSAPNQSVSGESTGLTLNEQLYIQRGEMGSLAGELPPKVSRRLRVSLFWLGKKPMMMKKKYYLKLGTARVEAHIEAIHRIIDASDLGTKIERDRIERLDVAECTLNLKNPIAFDLAQELSETSRFVIVDGYEISGGGIVMQDLPDIQSWVKDYISVRNYKWEKSMIPMEKRAEIYNQHSTLVIITGPRDAGKKKIAKMLETQLFESGKVVYYLGIGSVLYGMDADIKLRQDQSNFRAEHIRRLAEIAYILLDAGVILIITAIELTQTDLEIIKTIVNPDKIEAIWVSDNITTDLAIDLQVAGAENADTSVSQIYHLLQDHGIIFKP